MKDSIHPCNDVDYQTEINGYYSSILLSWTDSKAGGNYLGAVTDTGIQFLDITKANRPSKVAMYVASDIVRQAAILGDYLLSLEGNWLYLVDLNELSNSKHPAYLKPEASAKLTTDWLLLDLELQNIYALNSAECAGAMQALSWSASSGLSSVGCVQATDDSATYLGGSCYMYSGADSNYIGEEICLLFKQSGLSIWHIESGRSSGKLLYNESLEEGLLHGLEMLPGNSHVIGKVSVDGVTKLIAWDISSLEHPVVSLVNVREPTLEVDITLDEYSKPIVEPIDSLETVPSSNSIYADENEVVISTRRGVEMFSTKSLKAVLKRSQESPHPMSEPFSIQPARYYYLATTVPANKIRLNVFPTGFVTSTFACST